MLDKSAQSSSVRASGPLSGFRIVEFAGIGPGPFACMMLADIHGTAEYRANLIKVMAQRAVAAAG